MKSQSISDFVAATMDAVLKSDAHNAIFNKTASKDSKDSDSMYADDNDAKKKKMKKDEDSSSSSSSSSSDSSSADDSESSDSSDSSDADDNNHMGLDSDDEFAEAIAVLSEKFPAAAAFLKEHHEEPHRFPHADSVLMGLEDGEMGAEASFDVAIDSLLTASAALDKAGMEKTATLSLKLASLVVEAKKKEKDSKTKEKAAKEKAKKDEQAAKDKAAKEKAKEKEKAAKEKEKAAKEKAKEKAAKEKAKEKASKK